MFALVDVNNMYVSCERVFRPGAERASRWSSCPTTTAPASPAATRPRTWACKHGPALVRGPAPRAQAGLIALSANFELYGDMSSRMMALAAAFAPRQEIYSIDECFLDFDGVPGDLVAIGRELRAKVLPWTGLPTSVGFGPTKTLAKLANHVAKTADRKPGSYPRELAQVCDFGNADGRTSSRRDACHRRRRRSGASAARPRRSLNEAGIAQRARPGPRRRDDPAAAVQRRAREDDPRAARHAVPGGRRRARGEPADHVLALVRRHR